MCRTSSTENGSGIGPNLLLWYIKYLQVVLPVNSQGVSLVIVNISDFLIVRIIYARRIFAIYQQEP